ncbi:MAG: MBOAT family O-acyltransferase [Bacteroidota bacterium]
MVFSSPAFLFFFLPITILVTLLLPGVRLRNVFLLLASLFFYAWGEGGLVVLMLASITGNYLFGRWINRQVQSSGGKTALILAIAFNLILLGYYKYANFVVENINGLLGLTGGEPIHFGYVALPIGISFFTFQGISYLVDVYRKQTRVQDNPINLALYISLFPQLIAGPIVRYHDIAEQIANRTIRVPQFVSGIKRFIMGLGKKILIANVMAEAADGIFALPAAELDGTMLWLAFICYSFQIYFDFSGYSDMAIGLGRMFGFELLENFNYPFVARSLREFWRRWHISLTNWFRDYVYIPLGGNRLGTSRTYLNLMAIFFLTGMWHGASWSFIAWGMMHGVIMTAERLGLEKLIGRLGRPVQHLYFWLVLLLTWVPFRIESFPDVLLYWERMFWISLPETMEYTWRFFITNEVLFLMAVGIIGSMPVIPWIERQWGQSNRPAAWQQAFQSVAAVLHIAILMGCIMSLATNTYNPFIYFRF